MNLSELIFTDGEVISVESLPDGLTMDFKAYDNSLLEISFWGDLTFEIRDCFGYSIAKSILDKKDNGYQLSLKDDEGNDVFVVSFADAEYRPK